MHRTRILFLLILLGGINNLMKAQNIGDKEVSSRLEFLEKYLVDDQKATNLWWYGWLAGYSSATIGEGVVYFSSDVQKTRQDMAINAATCFAGFVGQFLSPLQPFHVQRELTGLPEGTEVERIIKLRRLEKLMVQRAEIEINARKWKVHVLPTAVNLVSGLVTWIGFHRSVGEGFANFGLNCLVTEAQIWTQPVRAKKALGRYYSRFAVDSPKISPREISFDFLVSAQSAGVKIVF